MSSISLAIEDGYLTETPEWCSHRRGSNWAAVISIDPASPGGLGRQFVTRGKGDYLYSVAEMPVGTAVEFAGDYTRCSGKKDRNRTYGVVIEVTEAMMTIKEYETGKAAIRAAITRLPEQHDPQTRQ